MQLEKPWINSNGKSKKKVRSSRKLAQASQDHDAWLRKKGVHPDQLAAKRVGTRAKQDIATPGYVYEPRRPKTSDKVGNGFDTGIMAKLHLEPVHVQQEILKKAQRIESLYNKGPSMYVTDGTDTTMLGGRSRRG